jgi:uncharacterized membrane protein YhaH (DUF805 family)/cold shock CspA family protein
MRGEVLHYDESQGFGFITAADGNRYTFSREDLRREVIISKGMQVEFQPSGSQAREIFSIRAQIGSVPVAGVPAADAPSALAPQSFGRAGVSEHPGNTGLWSYFWRGITDNYVNFRGRARRAEYWSFYLIYLMIGAVLMGIGFAVDVAVGNPEPGGAPFVTLGLFGLYFLATFLPGLAMIVRRQHDIGLSGWFYLLILIPYIGSLIIFVFSLIPSQKHENKWGPIPAGVRI